ncbi:carboxypeptidase-like regulatory domain-containing protein [Planctomicrobium sp. SH661]|uniref:carboxypeptidase-like regulatory domain-containing protein n=1 Tax=Planctomicrobium sp. SH661 TaxID=3448124 RepID=UPI003F5BDE08
MLRSLSAHVGTLSLMTFLLSGCSGAQDTPGLVKVTGLVTMNGAPLPGAEVTFRPEKGRLSSGITDDSGRYSLVYMQGVPGALPGKHTVSISTLIEANSDSDDPLQRDGRPESIAAKFNTQSTLEASLPAKGAVELSYDVEPAQNSTKVRKK